MRNPLSHRLVEIAGEKAVCIATWGLGTIGTSRLSASYLSFLGTVLWSRDKWNTTEHRLPSFDLIQAAEVGCYPICSSANRQNNMNLPAPFFTSRAEECRDADSSAFPWSGYNYVLFPDPFLPSLPAPPLSLTHLTPCLQLNLPQHTENCPLLY